MLRPLGIGNGAWRMFRPLLDPARVVTVEPDVPASDGRTHEGGGAPEIEGEVQDLRRLVVDVLASCPDPLFVVDGRGTIEQANSAADALRSRLSLAARDACSLVSILQRIHILDGSRAPSPFDVPRVGDLISLALDEQLLDEPVYDLRVRPRSSNGDFSPGHIVQLIDVTPLLAVMRGREAARRHRDGILSLLSHDLRSPHAAILATLNHPDFVAVAPNLRQIIERAARRALNMVDSLVLSVRAEASDYEFQDADLAHIVEEVVDSLWRRANDHKIQIDLDTGGGDHLVRVDQAMLSRAITDVISGFIAFGVAGHPISCRLGPAELDGSPGVMCEVSGSVRQISDGELARVFSRFATSQTADVGSLGGSDGLRLARTVVQRHGGRVTCEDLPGSRRNVTLLLPPGRAWSHGSSS